MTSTANQTSQRILEPDMATPFDGHPVTTGGPVCGANAAVERGEQPGSAR